VSGTGGSSFSRSAKRYEVQFQDDSHVTPIRTTWSRQGTSNGHSQTGISQHKYMTRLRKRMIFSARAYAEKRRDDSIGKS
jgi:hypothetical protein